MPLLDGDWAGGPRATRIRVARPAFLTQPLLTELGHRLWLMLTAAAVFMAIVFAALGDLAGAGSAAALAVVYLGIRASGRYGTPP